jgi:hypothetical protein
VIGMFAICALRAAMAWTMRREGCQNINWLGGFVFNLHAIVDAITLLGREFTPTQAELRRALREIVHRPSHIELIHTWRRARELGLKFEAVTFERSNNLGLSAVLEM